MKQLSQLPVDVDIPRLISCITLQKDNEGKKCSYDTHTVSIVYWSEQPFISCPKDIIIFDVFGKGHRL